MNKQYSNLESLLKFAAKKSAEFISAVETLEDEGYEMCLPVKIFNGKDIWYEKFHSMKDISIKTWINKGVSIWVETENLYVELCFRPIEDKFYFRTYFYNIGPEPMHIEMSDAEHCMLCWKLYEMFCADDPEVVALYFGDFEGSEPQEVVQDYVEDYIFIDGSSLHAYTKGEPKEWVVSIR